MEIYYMYLVISYQFCNDLFHWLIGDHMVQTTGKYGPSGQYTKSCIPLTECPIDHDLH